VAKVEEPKVAPENQNKQPRVEKPKVDLPVQRKATIPPATERQMSYLGVLVQRKRWSDKERDAEIVKVLGYMQTYSKLTKQEASKLIDAWKESK
jgi:hypothetical protein